MNIREMIIAQFGEEGSEIAQAAIKVLRFGIEETYQGETNLQRLVGEYIDILGVASVLQEMGLLPSIHSPEVAFGIQEKRAKIQKYLQISRELGTLQDDGYPVQ